jgi:hypothetical protein
MCNVSKILVSLVEGEEIQKFSYKYELCVSSESEE